MKPYIVIEGSNQSIDLFEEKVASALEMGYGLAGELVTHPVSASEVKFFQTMMLEDDEEEAYEEEDEEDEEEYEM